MTIAESVRWHGFGRTDTADVREHLTYLHDATVRIGGGLELDHVVAGFCEVAVPRLADVAAAYLREEVLTSRELPRGPHLSEVALRLVAMAEGDRRHGDTRADSKTLVDTVRLQDMTGPFAAALSEGRPAGWFDGTHGGTDLECVLPAGWTGFGLVVPLRLDDVVLGFAVLLRTPERETYGPADLLTATLMADQAALSVHKALLYQREAQIADALQRSMLPKRPPRLPGVEIAYRYLPANPTVQVGGDWFDAIPLAGSRVAFVVGDVMGHGVRSAATMGQLRMAVRTLATLDLPPDQVLRQLDQLVTDMTERFDDQLLATCVYCVYDPVSRRCAIANAGHVPPLFVFADGRTAQPKIPTGVPVGVGGAAFETVEVAAPDGAMIALCTDGLVESRRRDLTEGLTLLRESISPASAPLDDLCDRVLHTLQTDERVDDVALLIARFHGIPSENVAYWILHPHPGTPSLVRRLVAATLSDWNLTEHIETVELLATELVTNAIRYATQPITVRLLRTETLLCEVTDDDRHLPVLREPTETKEGGRGIYVVSQLARRWGTGLRASGKSVWCELPLQ